VSPQGVDSAGNKPRGPRATGKLPAHRSSRAVVKASTQPAEGPSGLPAEVPPRILVVEDDDDFRQLLSLTLELEGYAVDQASTAEDGLSRLGARPYRLILSDYTLPGHSGGWMLQHAAQAGLLGSTPALVVTSLPVLPKVAGADVISKSVKLEDLIGQVQAILAPGAGREPQPPVGGPSEAKEPIAELVLYVSPASVSSHRALARVREIVARCPEGIIEFSICDLSVSPSLGERDRIAFTPTLVKRRPAPQAWIVGDLENTTVLEDLLRLCGVEWTQ
jgi:DNA-binding response OmpR family regulator